MGTWNQEKRDYSKSNFIEELTLPFLWDDSTMDWVIWLDTACMRNIVTKCVLRDVFLAPGYSQVASSESLRKCRAKCHFQSSHHMQQVIDSLPYNRWVNAKTFIINLPRFPSCGIVPLICKFFFISFYFTIDPRPLLKCLLFSSRWMHQWFQS